jgi:hypothetical protein
MISAKVVAIPFGWWTLHSPGHVSANAVTSDGLSDLGGGGDWHDTRVEVAAQSQLSGNPSTEKQRW